MLSFALTTDGKYAFTASKDKQICCYYTQNWQMLCSLPFPFPTHDIKVTRDSIFLVALNKNKKMALYWQLSESTDGINLPLKKTEKINTAIISPNMEFMMIGYTPKGFQHNQGGFELWNLKSKVKCLSYDEVPW